MVLLFLFLVVGSINSFSPTVIYPQLPYGYYLCETNSIYIVLFLATGSKADNLTPSASRLSRECGSLNVSQAYWPPRTVIETALPFTFDIGLFLQL
jgi:hypothetical protein